MKAEGDLYDINNAEKCSLNEKNDLDYPAFVQQVRSFIAEKNLDQYGDVIVRGATLAEYGDDALDMAEVTDEERTVLLYERDHRWSHPWAMYFLAILNSISAAVQYVSLSNLRQRNG